MRVFDSFFKSNDISLSDVTTLLRSYLQYNRDAN